MIGCGVSENTVHALVLDRTELEVEDLAGLSRADN